MDKPLVTKSVLGENKQFTQQASQIIDTLKKNIETQYLKAVEGTYNEMVDAIFLPFVGLTVLWIVWYGFKIMGRKTSMQDFAWGLGFIVFVNLVFMNFGYAWRYFGEILIIDLPLWVESIFDAKPTQLLVDLSNSFVSTILNTLVKFESGASFQGVVFVYLILLVVVLLLLFIWVNYIFIYMMSFIKLTVLFMLTPVMVVLACFKSTRNYTLNWINFCAQPLFSLLLLNCLMSFLYKILHNGILNSTGNATTITATLVSLLIGGFIALMIADVPSISAGIVSAGFNMASERMPSLPKQFNPMSRMQQNQQAQQQRQFAMQIGKEVAKALSTKGASLVTGAAKNLPKG